MIPHKSRLFRCILDLSFQLHHKGKIFGSVNEGTVKLAPQNSMSQLGDVLWRLVYTMAENYNVKKPFVFTKLDVKDGFWRLSVNDDDAWNFCYVLPPLPSPEDIDETEIVVPNCLQMGWCESPPFFCASSETARDVMDTLLKDSALPPHPLDTHMIKNTPAVRPESSPPTHGPHVSLLEVFVDDFIGATNNLSDSHLLHFSRAMLHGLHSIFPPPEVTGHMGEDSVSTKKLFNGEGIWATRKEILGWIFDGIAYTIQLPPKKCDQIRRMISKLLKVQRVSLQKFQKLAGKLQHASFGLPNGRCLFSPLQTAMLGDPSFITLVPYLRHALMDWLYIIGYMKKNPTSVLLLVTANPSFIGYSDASGVGAGGVWCSGIKSLDPFVWRVPWPSDIHSALRTDKNPKGNLTINDLELAGAVLNWLALEARGVHLSFCHVAMFCDNRSAVAWAFKLRTSRSVVAGRLLRLLGIRLHSQNVSSLTPSYLAGDENRMADVVSRAFKNGDYPAAASSNLISFFNRQFPLTQAKSWTELILPSNLISRVIACLRGEQLPMVSLLRLPQIKKSTGHTGANTCPPAESTRFLTKSRLPSKKMSTLQHSLQGSGQECTVEELKLWLQELPMRSRPLARPSNWLENPAPSTNMTKSIGSPSPDSSKDIVATIHPLSRN